MFNVNQLVYFFSLLARLLLKTADREENNAANLQKDIDTLSQRKNAAVKEAKRARTVADNIQKLVG